MKRSAIEVLREASRHVPNEIYVEVDAAIDEVVELIAAAHETEADAAILGMEIPRLRAALARLGGAE